MSTPTHADVMAIMDQAPKVAIPLPIFTALCGVAGKALAPVHDAVRANDAELALLAVYAAPLMIDAGGAEISSVIGLYRWIAAGQANSLVRSVPEADNDAWRRLIGGREYRAGSSPDEILAELRRPLPYSVDRR